MAYDEPYDDAEARRLLLKWGGMQPHFSTERRAAAPKLLQALARLNQTGGMPIQLDDKRGRVLFSFGYQRSVAVGYSEDDGCFVMQDVVGQELRSKAVDRMLYNPETDEWEGIDDDGWYVQEPGKPKRKRSALAVIIMQVLSFAASTWHEAAGT